MSEPAPLILTLAMDEASFAFFDRLRRRHFPPERNLIPAHLTLFHALPGAHRAAIVEDVAAAAANLAPFPLAVTGLRPLGRGVAYTLASEPLGRLRARLATLWDGWLTPQDRGRHAPHVTVQNKADPAAARTLLAALAASFEPFTATATGLDLWHYRGGPWELAARFSFTDPAPFP
jgi:2'-5' RNA ligase